MLNQMRHMFNHIGFKNPNDAHGQWLTMCLFFSAHIQPLVEYVPFFLVHMVNHGAHDPYGKMCG